MSTSETTSSQKTTPYQTVLVTGGAGFIGSWFVRHWLETRPNSRVINLDALTYAGNLDNLKPVTDNAALASRYEFIHGDICDTTLVERLMRGKDGQAIDACVHIAAETHVDRSIVDPHQFVQTNVLGTQVLLNAARQAGIQRFLMVSTDEVYGSLPLETPERFTEASPIVPSSPYSSSKAASDLLSLSYYHTYGLPVVVSRCSNNYGPNQYPEKLIPFFIHKLQQGEPVPVYGDGLNVRDWLHVSDHVKALALILEQGRAGEVYNISAHNERSNIEMTKRLLTLMQLPESRIDYVVDRLGHDRRYALDATKLRTELGWQPEIEFETGLAETVAWYRQSAKQPVAAI